MGEHGENRALLGVTLSQYATFLAGRADGLPLRELVALTGIAPAVWAKAERPWGERLLDDLEAGGALNEELQQAMIDAQRRWVRPLPPLDTDLRAHLDFSRAYAVAVDAAGFLSRVGMHQADMVRLDALWADRLNQDDALRAEAVAILAHDPRPPCVPAPEPARLLEMETRR